MENVPMLPCAGFIPWLYLHISVAAFAQLRSRAFLPTTYTFLSTCRCAAKMAAPVARLTRDRTGSANAVAEAAATQSKKFRAVEAEEAQEGAAASSSVTATAARAGGKGKGGGKGGGKAGRGAGRTLTVKAAGGKEEDIGGMLLTILKAVHQNATLMRHVTGSMWLAFHSPLTCPVAHGVMEEGALYNTQVKEAGKAHTLGSPHVHQAFRFLEELSTHTSIVGPLKLQIQAAYDRYQSAGADVVADAFLCLRIKKCRQRSEEDDPKAVVTMAFSALATVSAGGESPETPLQMVILEAMKAIEWTRLFGPPPKSELERQLGQWIEHFSK